MNELQTYEQVFARREDDEPDPRPFALHEAGRVTAVVAGLAVAVVALARGMRS